MTGPSAAPRLAPRTNTSPRNTASWIVALGILTVVIPASEKVAANQVFLAAHGVSAIAWLVLLLVVVAVGWLVLAGALTLAWRGTSEATFDRVASGLTLVVAWFLVGNVLARAVLSGLPILGAILGLLVAIGITLLARRLSMGTILLAFAAVAAAVPLASSIWAGTQDRGTEEFAFDTRDDRPSVVWIISDELQYPLVFDRAGRVRPQFANLAALQAESTTYTRAYSTANYTDYAVPSMLSGISDVAARGLDRMQDVRASIGIIPGLATEYSVVMESPIYSFECETAACASVGASDVGPVRQYFDFAKDTAAIVGRTTLAAPFSDLFPSLDGKWRDFWSQGEEFGDEAEGDSVGSFIAGLEYVRQAAPAAPVLGFWHSIRTHAPWAIDREGRQMFPARVPIVPGAHMAGSEADQTYTTDELKSLQRRLYASAAVDFDRQLGVLIEQLRATGQYDDTMIVLTSDHGATMTERLDRRLGDSLEQRWSEIAHVPLLVKDPGQASPQVVTAPRSTGQIAASVMRAVGVTTGADLTLSPDLSVDLPSGPVFTTVAGDVLTPWTYTGAAEVDPWRAEDLSPVDSRHPFAVGIDSALLGAAVPAGWTEVAAEGLQVLSGESDHQLVIVDRDPGACAVEETAGLVSVGGTVVGSVLWESSAGSMGGQTRGWAIVPRADIYAFWCSG